MMIRLFIYLLPYFLVLPGIGQKANYREAERFLGSKLQSVPLRLVPNRIHDSGKFWYKFETSEGVRYYIADPKTGEHREMFDREFMAGEISKLNHEAVNCRNLNLKNFGFKKDNRTMMFMVDSFRVEYDVYSKRLDVKDPKQQKAELETEKARKDKKNKGKEKDMAAPKRKMPIGNYSPDGKYAVYLKGYDLYLFTEEDSTETRLTRDGMKKYCYGNPKDEAKDSTTARRVKVTWWNDSKYFVVERSDMRKVGTFDLVDNHAKIPVVRSNPYARPGDEFVEQFELHVGDTRARRLKRVATEKWKDQKVVLHTVSDKNKVYFLRKRRTCDEVDFCLINPVTGEAKVLINEVNKPYFNDQLFSVRLNRDGSEIIWWSERTGHGHYYMYDGEGHLKYPLTSGNWTAADVVRVDTTGAILYFYAYGQAEGEMPYFKKLNRVRLDGKGGVKLLTPEEATHHVTLLKDGYFVDSYSRVDLPPRNVVRNRDGKVVMDLCSPDLKWLYERGWKAPESFTVKAADGVTDLYGYMWKPFDFDSTRQYPIISYVYPGPQTEAIPLEFLPSGMLCTSLAQVGFIVVSFGHRGGSPVRDKWYHTYGHGNLRDYPLADDKAGIEQLIARYPFINGRKVGIIGHSGGGFMATAALCTYTDFYTAAVASAGNHDNTIYNQWWGETHHGLKEKKSSAKKPIKSPVTGKDSTTTVEEVKYVFTVDNTMELAPNLKGHLMLVFGDADNNVHPANTLRMAYALLQAGKNFDMVVLPGQSHAYYGKSMDFFQRKAWFHFAKHLLGDYSCEEFSEIDGFMRLK